MKYRKKPVVIEATQWHKIGDHPEVILGWKNHDSQIVVADNPALNVHGLKAVCCIKTLEGWHEVTPGDWIITGVKGELYPCKDEIFRATYEACDEDQKTSRLKAFEEACDEQIAKFTASMARLHKQRDHTFDRELIDACDVLERMKAKVILKGKTF